MPPCTNEWRELYAAVNLCNGGINRIEKAGLSAALRPIREGELRFPAGLLLLAHRRNLGWRTLHDPGNQWHCFYGQQNTCRNDLQSDFRGSEICRGQFARYSAQYGKVTKGAAQAFLARMYLTRGMNKEALEMAEAVLKGNYGYKLEANYADLWKMSNLKTKEAIYVVDYSTNLALNDLANSTFNPYGHSRGSNNASPALSDEI